MSSSAASPECDAANGQAATRTRSWTFDAVPAPPRLENGARAGRLIGRRAGAKICRFTVTMPASEYPDAPRVAIGTVVIKGGAVLLVRRSKPPSKGLWAIPGGSVELGETLQQAAERELFEETGVRVKAGAPCFAFDALHRDQGGRVKFHYVIVDLRAEWIAGEPSPRDDALDARWVRPEELEQLEVSERTLELLREAADFGGF